MTSEPSGDPPVAHRHAWSRTAPMLAVALICLLMMVGAAWWTIRSGRLVAAGLLTGLSVLWLLVNHPLEGPVLFTVAPGHGLVLADLLTPVAVALALACWYPGARRRRRRRRAVAAPDEPAVR